MTRPARSRLPGRVSEKLFGIARNSPALAGGIILGVALVAAALGGLAGAAFGHATGMPASDRASYRDARVQTIGAHLRQLDGDYVLVAGDSHIEHWWVRSLCGLPVVNAGLSGATVESYARFFAELPLLRPPRAIILTIGTNDAQTRRIGDPAKALGRFRTSIESLILRLRQQTPRIIATAVPPLDSRRAQSFSPRLAARFSSVLETVCHEQGCRFVDPFARGVELFDGVHLADYAGVYAGFEHDLCPALGDPPPVRTAAGANRASGLVRPAP